jgi:tRNA(Ile)-lysidine synthetase-like protein
LLDRWEIYLSPQAAAQGLEVRSWQAGDAYQPLGSSKPKKIKELFLRKRIGSSVRSGWPVVTCGGKIICVRGFPVAADHDLHQPFGAGVKVVIEERTLEG